jgi:hypothetical protein
MQNPALGAALIWRFACGYAPQKEAHDGVPLPLAFVVLPVVLHERTRKEITSTRVSSGARKFEEKFRDRGDMLFALNQRAIGMRPLSLRSVRQALASGLLTLVVEQGTIWPRTYTKPPVDGKAVSSLLGAAEKLGRWCHSLSVYEISGILRVEF